MNPRDKKLVKMLIGCILVATFIIGGAHLIKANAGAKYKYEIVLNNGHGWGALILESNEYSEFAQYVQIVVKNEVIRIPYYNINLITIRKD